MNCKPGDLALITKDSASERLAGRLVEVLYLAPADDFNLPDGYPHQGQRRMTIQDQWVIKFLGGPASALCERTRRSAQYGCVPDRYLRPLRGDLDDEQIPTSTPAETCR